MIIGRSERPTPFDGKYGHEFGLDYHFNQKSRMTKILFFEWMERFARYISRTEIKKLLLLINNCAAIGAVDLLPVLNNIVVHFLTPNTTSRLQPLHAGIVVQVKENFGRRSVFRVFENIQDGRNYI